jgi:hypothetical protein
VVVGEKHAQRRKIAHDQDPQALIAGAVPAGGPTAVASHARGFSTLWITETRRTTKSGREAGRLKKILALRRRG